MELRVEGGNAQLRPETATALARVLSPMTGLTRGIGFMSRSPDEPRILTAGAELTGVHILLDRPDPGPGRYHIGGSGLVLDEAIIRCVGETVERYGQFVWDVVEGSTVKVATYDEMLISGLEVLSPTALTHFTPDQFQGDGFPFQPFNPSIPCGWILMDRLGKKTPCWVPAHLVIVGYRRRASEHRVAACVTTGTAAHTCPGSALANALLEIIQIDAAMGHWYSGSAAPEIHLDHRTAALHEILSRHVPTAQPAPRFHLLASPDLPGFSVACVLRRPSRLPAVGVGLGCGLRLEQAMYKALLEAAGTIQLAKKSMIDRQGPTESAPDPNAIYDLDTNVMFYANQDQAAVLDDRFAPGLDVRASDLPPDTVLTPDEEVALLVEAFDKSGKDLFVRDLTTPDIEELGFAVTRVWSPSTLSLSLPSAPPLAHPRFDQYGGVARPVTPHPYP